MNLISQSENMYYGFLKYGVYRFWNLVLELVNRNGVTKFMILMLQYHNGACCLGSTRGCVFASPISQFEI
jgi:hypothetical protein